MRYTIEAQFQAIRFAKETHGNLECHSVFYMGSLADYGLVFFEAYIGRDVVPYDPPHYILVDEHGAKRFFDFDKKLTQALEKKYPCVFDEMGGGWVAPTQRAKYREVEAQVESEVEQDAGENYGYFDHTNWLQAKKRLLREKYHINWRTPLECYPYTMWD